MDLGSNKLKFSVPVRGEFSMNTYNDGQLILFGGCNIALTVSICGSLMRPKHHTEKAENGSSFAPVVTPPGSWSMVPP